jgi:exopolyphosphatase / guanosine-5'-triphosphate,3'-diphosphate pyrophosphatase
LFTVRNLLFTSILFTLISCSTTKNSKVSSCLEKRGAIDIGSGTTKLVVAQVNTCNNSIDHIFFEAHRAIPFKENLQRSKDGKFSPAMINKAIGEIQKIVYTARSQGARKIRAVATSAFRTAKNAKEAALTIEKTLNLPIKIITQTDEALLAYNAGLSQAISKEIISANEKNVAVWDIGGGSMQIIKKGPSKQTIYLGKLASVSFKNKVLKDILKKEITKSPNPLKKKNAVEAMNLARRYSNKHAKPLLSTLKNFKIIGAGGVHFHSVRKQINSPFNYYERGELLQTLLHRATYSDKKIGGNFAKTDVTNLALVLGFMQSLSIEKVIPLKINMAHGLLTSPQLWDK